MFVFNFSGQVRPRQGTEICNFGAPSPLEALHWIFCFFSSIYVQFSKMSPTKSGESSEKSSGEIRVESCHVCGCHGFFGPEFWTPRYSRPRVPRSPPRICGAHFIALYKLRETQKSSRRLWRCQRRKAGAFPNAGPKFPGPFSLSESAQTMFFLLIF